MRPDAIPHELLQGYFAGALDETQVEQLSAWIEASPVNAAYVQQLGWLDLALKQELQNQSVDQLSAEERAFIDRVDPDAWQMILDSALISKRAGEEAATSEVVGQQAQEKHSESIRVSDVISLSGYLAAQALRKNAAMIAGLAAVVAIAVTLFVVFGGGGDATVDPLANQDPGLDSPADPPSIPTLNVVATITAEYAAVWGRRPGQDLYAGQRLKLDEGFAEITTARGAVALLQAPATIELLDSNNAVYLYDGKLVGICETEASKGFLVRTPHMDITDLGTRFGVDASSSEASEIHVFEGEVQVDRPGSQAIRLTTDQSARSTADVQGITTIDHDSQRFTDLKQAFGVARSTPHLAVVADTQSIQWLIATSGDPGSVSYAGNLVTSSITRGGFLRAVVGGNTYGYSQYQAFSAGAGQPATAKGTWTFTNLPAGQYDVATSFGPRGGGTAIRYTVNGAEVLVDQSQTPDTDEGPTFDRNVRGPVAQQVHFTMIGSSVTVAEGGSIVVTIDNANTPAGQQTLMDSVAITRLKEVPDN